MPMLLAIAAGATAADRMYVVYGFWVSPKSCHVRNAVDVAFADYAARPKDFDKFQCGGVKHHGRLSPRYLVWWRDLR